MLIKHLAHGSGSGKGASQYLTQEVDAKGTVRAEVKVLEGNPEMVGAVADSLNFKHKYCSGVIAWAPDDQPTEEQIEAVVEDYKKLAFAGLEEQDYAFTAVQHREENGGVHVHVLSARVDLATGKSFNPCPPGVRFQYDKIAEAHNWEHGWARPDDPERTRIVSKDHLHYKDAKAVKQGLEIEPDVKTLLTNYIRNLTVSGAVESQADVVEALKEFGEITRVGKGYVSIKLEGDKRATRLKGGLFGAEFSREDTAERSRENSKNTSIDREKSSSAFREFERICKRKEQANTEKYRSKSQGNTRANKRATGRSGENKTSVLQTIFSGDSLYNTDLFDYLRGELGDDAILWEASNRSSQELFAGRPQLSRATGVGSNNSTAKPKGTDSDRSQTGKVGDVDHPGWTDCFASKVAKTEIQERLKNTIKALSLEQSETRLYEKLAQIIQERSLSGSDTKPVSKVKEAGGEVKGTRLELKEADREIEVTRPVSELLERNKSVAVDSHWAETRLELLERVEKAQEDLHCNRYENHLLEAEIEGVFPACQKPFNAAFLKEKSILELEVILVETKQELLVVSEQNKMLQEEVRELDSGLSM